MAHWEGRYINLDRSPERRRLVEDQIAGQGLADRYRRFPAVDGRVLGRDSPRSQAEVGIFRSHMDILREASCAPGAIHVIEDDVLLCDLTAPAIDRTVASGALDTFDVVFLETYIPLQPRAIRAYRELFERCTRGRWPIAGVDQIRLVDIGARYFFGATSYLVGARGARRLLDVVGEEWDALRGPSLPFDDTIQKAVRAGRIRVGCLMPFVTAIDLRTAQDSTAERAGEDLSTALVQRVLRHSFYARRDLEGYVIPRLEATLARVRPAASEATLAVDRRILEYLYLTG